MTREQRERAMVLLSDRLQVDNLYHMSDESVVAALEGLRQELWRRDKEIWNLITEIGGGK